MAWGWVRDSETPADRARAAACVTACEGIEDPADLRRQRDILLKACKDVEKHYGIVAGNASQYSTTMQIVHTALRKIGEDNDGR